MVFGGASLIKGGGAMASILSKVLVIFFIPTPSIIFISISISTNIITRTTITTTTSTTKQPQIIRF